MAKRRFGLTLVLCLFCAILCGCGNKNSDSLNSSAVSSQPVSQVVVTPEPAKNAKAVKISADGGLNIRSKPSTDGDIVGIADDGGMLPLLIENPSNGWYEVEYNGASAYISAEYASVIEVTLEDYNKLKAGEELTSAETPVSTSVNDDPALSTSQSTPAPTQKPTAEPTGAINNEDGE